MYRFIDLRNDYWYEPEPTAKGPFAFIDTTNDTFITVGGRQIFHDVGELLEEAERANTPEAEIDRMLKLVPDDLMPARAN